mmetsp:Transcript_11688/g.27118  ORF Transcript_11688/g.27118 Transcript_11688/m.27118 type:complete len:209 (-) Transcript_11688:789-1415(-)
MGGACASASICGLPPRACFPPWPTLLLLSLGLTSKSKSSTPAALAVLDSTLPASLCLFFPAWPALVAADLLPKDPPSDAPPSAMAAATSSWWCEMQALCIRPKLSITAILHSSQGILCRPGGTSSARREAQVTHCLTPDWPSGKYLSRKCERRVSTLIVSKSRICSLRHTGHDVWQKYDAAETHFMQKRCPHDRTTGLQRMPRQMGHE